MTGAPQPPADPSRTTAPPVDASRGVASPAADFAVALLRELVALGVTDAVLTPGSRSQALALALAEFDRARMLDLQVRIDERSAAFLALGLAAETGRPAIVVVTSGTAVANLLPAVLEASHSNVPMLLLTSDRPSEMRATGGNQTTHQPGLFGRFTRLALDVEAPLPTPAPTDRDGAPGANADLGDSPAPAGRAGSLAIGNAATHAAADLAAGDGAGAAGDAAYLAASGGADVATRAAAIARAAVEAALGTYTGHPGPVHLNLQFREPLSGAIPDLVAERHLAERHLAERHAADDSASNGQVGIVRDALSPASHPRAPVEVVLPRGPRTVVIAGHDSGPAAEQLAHDAGWPLIAEPSSGARFGRNLVIAYRELLNDATLGGRVERAVVFGHPTLSREVPALSLRPGVETIVVTPAAVAGETAAPDADVYNPGHRVRTFAAAVSAAPVDDTAPDASAARTLDAEWLRDWVLASRAIVDALADDVAPPNVDAARSPDIAERRDYRLSELAALRAPVTRRTLALAVWRVTWPHDRLVLGASRLIRDLDRAVPGKNIRVHANRGLAGIDGTIATALGIALASQRPPEALDAPAAPPGPDAAPNATPTPTGAPPMAAANLPDASPTATATSAGASPMATATSAGASPMEAATAADSSPTATATSGDGAAPAGPARAAERQRARAAAGVTRVLLGDLTLLHDVGSLLIGVGERRPRIQLIVGNDGGGTIFDTLEVAATADRSAFDRVMMTPQDVDLESLARAYGWSYSRATTRSELDRALTAPITGPAILEVPLGR